MFTELLNALPEVIVVGNIEMLFLGAALALGLPSPIEKIIKKRYGVKPSEVAAAVEGESEPDEKADE